MKKYYYLLLLSLLLLNNSFAQPEITSRLQAAISKANPDEYIRVIVYLRDQVDIEALDAKLYRESASLEKRAYDVITALKEKANSSQGMLSQFFSAKQSTNDIQSWEKYWIVNMFLIHTKASVIEDLRNNMQISMLELDDELDYDRAIDEGAASESSVLGTEPGPKILNADKLWALGYRGEGRIVMNIDTGVFGTHAALAPKWRGNNGVPWYQAWFSPVKPTIHTPNDCQTHGTHTMGILCGSVTGDTVGVAPGAQWIAAQVTDCPGASYPTHNVASFQWAMNPDSNASTITDMPDLITCSWTDPGAGDQCNGLYKQLMLTVEASGIGVVFSAGNSGSSASTITTPKNNNANEVSIFCVGNIQGALYLQGNQNPISSSSSRGPSTCGGTGSLLIKPEVCAPGTSIRSTIPSGYGNMSGTSMASPHIGGCIALLKQIYPDLTGTQIKYALYNTARDLGTAGEDNTYGKGLVDVYAAMQLLATPVELISFYGQAADNSVVLRWSTSTETNNKGFDIEKIYEADYNSGVWVNAAFISGNGTTTSPQDYSFYDRDVKPGKYIYRLKQIDFDGTSDYSREVEVIVTPPAEYTLYQNYPNPFNPSTTIEFSLPTKSDVTITLFNSLGEKVKMLYSQVTEKGFHSVQFNADGLSSGTYIYQMRAVNGNNTVTQSKKLSIVK